MAFEEVRKPMSSVLWRVAGRVASSEVREGEEEAKSGCPVMASWGFRWQEQARGSYMRASWLRGSEMRSVAGLSSSWFTSVVFCVRCLCRVKQRSGETHRKLYTCLSSCKEAVEQKDNQDERTSKRGSSYKEILKLVKVSTTTATRRNFLAAWRPSGFRQPWILSGIPIPCLVNLPTKLEPSVSWMPLL